MNLLIDSKSEIVFSNNLIIVIFFNLFIIGLLNTGIFLKFICFVSILKIGFLFLTTPLVF